MSGEELAEIGWRQTDRQEGHDKGTGSFQGWVIRHYLDCAMLSGSFAKARTYQLAQFKYVPSLYVSWTSTRGLKKRKQHTFHKDACTGKCVFHTLCLGRENADRLHSAPAAQTGYRAEHRRPTAGTTVPTPAGKGAWGWAGCLIS